MIFFFIYGDAEFGYRFLDSQNQKIIKSMDIVFDEQVLYEDGLSISH